jgi:hypothetical protein
MHPVAYKSSLLPCNRHNDLALPLPSRSGQGLDAGLDPMVE